MKTYPLYPERNVTDLNGVWQFRFFEKTWLEDVNENSFVPIAANAGPRFTAANSC